MERSARERSHFDALAGTTGEVWWGHRTPAGQERLRRRVRLLAPRLNSSASVLELGCGAGALSIKLLEAMPELNLTGCDISPVSLELARERCRAYPQVRFEEADVGGLPYASAAFQAVIGNSILHHVPLGPVLRESLRVLEPQGAFAFFEPNMLNPQVAVEKNIPWIGGPLENTRDETAFVRWRLAATLREAGFVGVSVQPFDFLHPSTPGPLIPLVDGLGRVLERIPLLREIAGSLQILAFRPA